MLKNLLRPTALSAMMTLSIAAQSSAPARPDASVPANEPYRGQTGLPNNAARNDQPNTALSGNTPQTNSSMQQTRNGNLGVNYGWLGVLGLAGLLGLGRRSGDPETHTPTAGRG